MRALILAALVFAGCPRPVPPPVPITTITQIPTCPPTEPTTAGVCDGLFTEDGLAAQASDNMFSGTEKPNPTGKPWVREARSARSNAHR